MDSRTLPHNIDAERALLGAMLSDSQAVNDAVEKLSAQAFYDQSHVLIFKAIVDLYNENKDINLITLQDALQSGGTFDVVGGMSYLTALSDQGMLITNADDAVAIIKDKATIRSLIKSSQEIAESGYSGVKAADLLELAEKSIFDISQNKNSEGLTHIKEVVSNAFDNMKKLYDQTEPLTGTTTGLAALDQKTSGLHSSDLILLAARPAMGKSALALNICKNAAKSGASVAVFSLEMSKEQYVQRLIASEALIDLGHLLTGQLEDSDWDKLIKGMGTLSSLDMYFDDNLGISVTEIKAKCRRLKLENKLDLIMIDYLQLMQGSGSVENRQQEISKISRGLKAIARELEVPVIALSQLSRATEQRNDHRPILSDLRESGAIEQDADIVMFLYRGEYYDENDESLKNLAELIIAKHRNGETGTINLHWMGQYQLFRDLLKREF